MQRWFYEGYTWRAFNVDFRGLRDDKYYRTDCDKSGDCLDVFGNVCRRVAVGGARGKAESGDSRESYSHHRGEGRTLCADGGWQAIPDAGSAGKQLERVAGRSRQSLACGGDAACEH